MKAKPVRGLDPDGAFDANARRIVSRRLRELEDLAAQAFESGDPDDLHDMRIAAKRLRYVLEVCQPALGPGAAKGAKTAKSLQGLLGDIHDCDELAPRIRRHIRRLRREDADALYSAFGPEDLDPGLARAVPNRVRYRGLNALLAYVTARRAGLLDRVREEWEKLDDSGFGAHLLDAISGPPELLDPPAGEAP